MLIQRSHVRYFNQYAKSPDFLFIFKFLEDRRTRVTQTESVWGDIQTLEKMSWLANAPTITSSGRPLKRLKLDPISVAHHAFHDLIGSTIVGSLKGRALSVLLAESLSSCLDLYFSLTFYKAEGLNHPEPVRYLERILEGKGRHTPAAERAFNEGLKNPFSHYRKVALEMFNFAELGYQYCQAIASGKSSLGGYSQKLKKLKYRSLYGLYDHNTFMLYAACHCGFKNKKQDLIYVKKMKALLNESKSFAEFSQKLLALSDKSAS